MKFKSKLLASLCFAFVGVNANAMPIAVDVVTVIDESGSMAGEHAWIGGAILSLDAGLQARAAGDSLSSNYGLVGFGATTSHGEIGHPHMVGGSELGTAAEFNAATSSLVTTGIYEDGYSGIDVALNYPLNPGHATNIILVTDEDRDNRDSSLNAASVTASIISSDALLNAVVNCYFSDNSGSNNVIGISADGSAYVADGAGGYNVTSGGSVTNSCFGTTNYDYVQLALNTGGAAWNLNLLRQGGLVADSFTAAFVDIKVAEIVEQVSVPEPSSIALLGLGLVGLGLVRRRKLSA